MRVFVAVFFANIALCMVHACVNACVRVWVRAFVREFGCVRPRYHGPTHSPTHPTIALVRTPYTQHNHAFSARVSKITHHDMITFKTWAPVCSIVFIHNTRLYAHCACIAPTRLQRVAVRGRRLSQQGRQGGELAFSAPALPLLCALALPV